jgi:hypothetical protein
MYAVPEQQNKYNPNTSNTKKWCLMLKPVLGDQVHFDQIRSQKKINCYGTEREEKLF